MDNELYHYGILGMKWGIRRYQNADGSLTAAGRKRYDAGEAQKTSASSESSTPRVAAKSASDMTDEELSKALNRMRMEQQYNELTGAKNKNQYQNQQSFLNPPSNTGALSNAELQAYITRLDLEKRYGQLTAPPPKEVSAGKKFMQNVVGPAFNEVAKAYIVKTLRKMAGLEGDKNQNNNNDNDSVVKKLSDKFDNLDKRMTELGNKVSNAKENTRQLTAEMKKEARKADAVITDPKASKSEKQKARMSKGLFNKIMDAVNSVDDEIYGTGSESSTSTNNGSNTSGSKKNKKKRGGNGSQNIMREANDRLADALQDLGDALASNSGTSYTVPPNSPVWETSVSSYPMDWLYD